MSQSGVSVNPDCVNAYNDLKLKKKNLKYIIYKLSDDYKEVVIEDQSDDKDYESFREKLINAQSKSKTGKVGKGPRFAVYDFEFELPNGEGTRNKIAFIAWSPDDAGIQPKMIYASSKETFKNALTGIATEIQANGDDDLEEKTIMDNVTKGKR